LIKKFRIFFDHFVVADCDKISKSLEVGYVQAVCISVEFDPMKNDLDNEVRVSFLNSTAKKIRITISKPFAHK
jgi:hypothetical protein